MITQFLSDVYYPASFPHYFICLNWRWKGDRKVVDPKENEIECYPLKIFIQSIMSCQDISHWKFWTWKDFFFSTTPAHFSNSLDFKLPTLQKLSQTKGRFIFQLKDQRALLLSRINTNHRTINTIYLLCSFSWWNETVDFCKKHEPCCKNTSKQSYWQVSKALRCSNIIYSFF